MTDAYLVSPEQTLLATRQAGLGEEQLTLSGVAVLTFSRAVVERLDELCELEDAEWISAVHHPYAAARVVRRGGYKGLDVTAIVPPMGASPLACILEDLVACGVEAVFLVCAAWSLGPPVRFGELIVPTGSVGLDGTSIHYGNEDAAVQSAPVVVDALSAVCRARGLRHHVGSNGTCQALYRITPEMAETFRRRGCLCVDNGEANTLFAVARRLNVLGGVLFQPYIDLVQGWDPGRLGDEGYGEACRLQAEVALEASLRLADSGWLGRRHDRTETEPG